MQKNINPEFVLYFLTKKESKVACSAKCGARWLSVHWTSLKVYFTANDAENDFFSSILALEMWLRKKIDFVVKTANRLAVFLVLR